jgi:hypothetical protein
VPDGRYVTSVFSTVDSRRRLIFLVRATRDNPQRVNRQRPLQRLGFIPRRA